ncbi:PadR family transcriptional regulator [Agreia pratensis]|uniref:DNA-binding transcriptional regulator, PadR family n=1 Tax=Agreia pratensis TaxID=150121 RepID=A0A1X7I844_9MICO|nr:PadR family transcriptional regulator [Agreia pratensis]SMG10779.1 DNA-binding transcriptional regulator, PadR family [Agreia pratensis]
MTPVFGHGHLRLYLLKLLDESPKHGYELIQALSERFGGTYAPSAGTIYPRLAKLEDEGLVTKTADGRKTVYEITEAGRAELDSRESELTSIENDLTDSVRRLADEVRSGVGEAMKSLRADLASAARQAREATDATTQSYSSWFAFDPTQDAPGQDAKGDTSSDETRAADETPASADASRDASRDEIRDVDIALAEFRQSVRTALRASGARGAVPSGTAAAFARRLDEVRASLFADLGK